jgi:hypothetical protein
MDLLRLIEPRVKELTLWETKCLSMCGQGEGHWISVWASWRSTCHTGRHVVRRKGRVLHHCSSRKKADTHVHTSLCRKVAQSVQLHAMLPSPSAPLGPFKVLVVLVRNGAVEWQLRVLQITFHRPPGDRLRRHWRRLRNPLQRTQLLGQYYRPA